MIAMRLNENMVRCPGCATYVNPFVVKTIGAKQNKVVECPMCSENFEIFRKAFRTPEGTSSNQWLVHSQKNV